MIMKGTTHKRMPWSMGLFVLLLACAILPVAAIEVEPEKIADKNGISATAVVNPPADSPSAAEEATTRKRQPLPSIDDEPAKAPAAPNTPVRTEKIVRTQDGGVVKKGHVSTEPNGDSRDSQLRRAEVRLHVASAEIAIIDAEVRVLKRIAEVFKAKYEKAKQANKRVPGSVSENEIRHFLHTYEGKVAEVERLVIKRKARTELAVLFAKKSAEVDKLEYEKAKQANKRKPGSVPESELLRFQRATEAARTEIEVRFAEKSADVAKAEYEKAKQANKRKPGSVSEIDLLRLRLRYERATAEYDAVNKLMVNEDATLPKECDAVCVGWDESWRVYGYSAQRGKWHTWSSPPTGPIRSRAVFAYTRTRVAVMDGNRSAGWDNDGEPSGWLLDLASDTWSRIPPIPLQKPKSVRAWLSSLEFVGGELVAIGSVKDQGFAAVFDIRDRRWSRVNREMPIPPKIRTLHSAINWKVVFWGGYPYPEHLGAVYDVAENRWSKIPSAPLEFSYMMAGTKWNGNLFVCGGRQKEVYQALGARFDPTSNKWSRITDPPPYVGEAAATTTIGDQWFIFTWHNERSAPDKFSSIYNFKTQKWRKIPRSPLGRHDVAYAAALNDNKVLVYGGWEGRTEKFVRDAAIFDISTNSWKQIDPVPGDVPFALHPGW
ncbi:MAG: hypothetical protein IID44_05295 [Planctomycetes bacterium]|nr:hypothetical protein [Planctomycetota bacterium]